MGDRLRQALDGMAYPTWLLDAYLGRRAHAFGNLADAPADADAKVERFGGWTPKRHVGVAARRPDTVTAFAPHSQLYA
jgi:hypothetical protein